MIKVTLGTKQLREGLTACGVAVARRTTLPVTNSVHFEAKDKRLVMKSTDLQDAVITSIPCEVSEQFSVCVPCRTIGKYVGQGDGKVSMRVEGKECEFARDGIGAVSIKGSYEPKEFPPIPYDSGINWNMLDGKWFCKMLSIISNGCAIDQSRPVLNGVCFKDGEMAAADGFRLYALSDDRLKFGLGEENHLQAGRKVAAVVMRDTVLKIIKLFAKKDKLEIGFQGEGYTLSPNQPTVSYPTTVYFRSGDTVLIGQLVQAAFPNYAQLIPSKFTCKVALSTPLMLQRLEVLDPAVVKDGMGMIRMYFQRTNKNEDVCNLTAGSLDETSYELSLPVKILTPEEGKFALDWRFIIPAIKHFAQCYIELTSPSSPMKITGDIAGLTVVVMPMFVQWQRRN